jgi:hypothetical protein
VRRYFRDLYGKTGKKRQKQEVQVRLKKQASGPDLQLEKMQKKRRDAQTSGVDMTSYDPGSSGGRFARKRASGYNG